jgi:hypothetical protein
MHRFTFDNKKKIYLKRMEKGRKRESEGGKVGRMEGSFKIKNFTKTVTFFLGLFLFHCIFIQMIDDSQTCNHLIFMLS